MEREGRRYEKERGDVKKQEEMGKKGAFWGHCRLSSCLFRAIHLSFHLFTFLSVSFNIAYVFPSTPNSSQAEALGEMGGSGERWEQMRRVLHNLGEAGDQ